MKNVSFRLSSSGWLTKALSMLWLAGMMYTTACSTKKDDPAPSGGNAQYAIQMAAGGQDLSMGASLDLKLRVVDLNGNIVSAPSSVSYTVSPSNLGTVQNGRFVAGAETGTGVVTATMTHNGVTYTTQIPVVVTQPSLPFHVVPGAIVWSTGIGNINLETVYFGTGAPSNVTYTSANTSVVTVSNTGEVSFVGNGNTKITVNATINGKQETVEVPVLVVGAPSVPLPVARVAVTPNPVTLFRGETVTLQPKAYNSNNAEVTGETFTYQVINKDTGDQDQGPIVNVSASGVVTPVRTGNATIIVTARGISRQVEVEVLPDFVILNDPFFKFLGTDPQNPFGTPDTEVTITARTYAVDRVKYRAKDYSNMLTLVANPAALQWMKPSFGIPQIDALFDVVDIVSSNNSTALVRKKATATAGSTFIFAYNPGDLTWTDPGVTAITVAP